MKRYWMFLLIAIFWSCSDDEDVTPSLKDQDRLEVLLDKSNSDIMAFKEKYGTYILYDFDLLLDFAYQFEMAGNWRSARLTYLEKEDISGAVEFLKQHFFGVYADSMKMNCFPRKFLICSKIYALTLGVSVVKDDRIREYHDAVANMNSFTVAELDRESLAGMSKERLEKYVRQLHYMFLGGYVLNVRRNIFVNNVFFDPSAKLYATKIERVANEVLTEDYFMSRGFFYIKSDENYYPQQLEDLRSFVQYLVQMDEITRDKVMAHSVMRIKMQYVVKGLKDMGVDVAAINSLANDFL